MKAALKTADGRFEVKEVETPTIPQSDWVLARVRVAGICGTDLRHWEVPDPKLKGKIMGHELAGEVVEVGGAVKNVKQGDRVVIETVVGDEDCDWCRVKRYNVCPNLYPVRMENLSQAFAEFVAGPADKFYRLPDHVSFEEAALLDTFSVCLHAHHLSGLQLNDKVAVIGAGCIGIGQIQLAKISGADVIVTDVHDYALDRAKELGADVAVNSQKEDALAAVKEFTQARGADVTFECAGGTSMPTTLREAVSFTRIGGKVVIVGGFDEGDLAMPLPWSHIQKGEIQLIPSASYSFWGLDPEMKTCLDLLAKGKLKAKELVTHRFSIDDINQAFRTAADKEGSKVTFVAIEI